MRHYQITERITRPYSKGMDALLKRKKQSEVSITYNRQPDSDGTLFVENPENGLRFIGKCHEVARKEGRRFDSMGWYLDECCDETVQGGVFMLPHGRYIPATLDPWGNGASLDFSDIKDNAMDAVYAADRLAERYAEVEREYQRVESAKMRVEDITAEIKDAYAACRDLCNEIRASGVEQVAVVRKLIRREVCAMRRDLRKLYKERDELRSQLA